jgi:pimeloyl-ACP methyl ester carboxylesterase
VDRGDGTGQGTAGTEAGGRVPHAWRRLSVSAGHLRAALPAPSLRAAALEAAWITTHLALYPVGLLRERVPTPERYGLAGLPPIQRGLWMGDVEAPGRPIVLVHGMADNRAIFAVLTRGLRRRGFHNVVSLNYSPATNDIRAAARRLHAEIEALVAQTGHERIHLIGHSLGGLIARYYVQRLDGDQRVDTLVTLGTPHSGTLVAHLLPMKLGRQLRPGSDLLRELEQPAPGCTTRFVSYWSAVDQLVIPQQSARLQHPDLIADNIQVHGVGHMSLPIHTRLVHEVATLLSLPSSPPAPAATAAPKMIAQRSAPPPVTKARATTRRPRPPVDQSFSTGA